MSNCLEIIFGGLIVLLFILDTLNFILNIKNRTAMSQFTDAQKAIYDQIKAHITSIGEDVTSVLEKQKELQSKLEDALRNGVSQEEADALIAEGNSIISDLTAIDEKIPNTPPIEEEDDNEGEDTGDGEETEA